MNFAPLIDPLSNDAVQAQINVVPMNFRTEYKSQDNGEFVQIHKVDLVKKGSRGESTTWDMRILKKDQFLWPYVEPYFNRWMAGQEDPVDGTPIDVLPFLNPGIVAVLRQLHIRTAEDLAGATDQDLQRIGMGARGIRDKCRVYLETKDVGDLAAKNADLSKENELMRKDIEELKAMVNELTPKDRGRKKGDTL